MVAPLRLQICCWCPGPKQTLSQQPERLRTEPDPRAQNSNDRNLSTEMSAEICGGRCQRAVFVTASEALVCWAARQMPCECLAQTSQGLQEGAAEVAVRGSQVFQSHCKMLLLTSGGVLSTVGMHFVALSKTLEGHPLVFRRAASTCYKDSQLLVHQPSSKSRYFATETARSCANRVPMRQRQEADRAQMDGYAFLVRCWCETFNRRPPRASQALVLDREA